MRWKSGLFALACVGLVFANAFVAVRTGAVFTAAATNPANAFGAAASFCSGTAPSQVKWVTGFEYGTIQAAADVADGGLMDGEMNIASFTADSSVARTGTYSAKVVKTNGISPVLWKYVDPAGAPGSSATSNVVARFSIRFATLPGSNVVRLFDSWMGNGSQDWANIGYDSASKKFRAGFESSGSYTVASGSAISAGTWYTIDMRVTKGSPTKIDWRVNGVAQTTVTRGSAVNGWGEVEFGSGTTSDVYTAYYDDIIASIDVNSYPLPDGGVRALLPNGMGTITNPNSYLKDNTGSTNVSSTSWQLMDDGAPFTSRTDFVRQSSASASNYANVTFADVAGSTCVYGVEALVQMHSSGTSSNAVKTSVFDGATETVIHSDSVAPGTGASAYRTKAIASTGGWTATELNGLEFRIGAATSLGGAPYWDALMIEYYS